MHIADKRRWYAIGYHGCWGMPDIHEDPQQPGRYRLVWQRYRPGAKERIMDVKAATYDVQRHQFSPEKYLFRHQRLEGLQAHPCWGYWRGAYRVFYCQCLRHDPKGKGVELSAPSWEALSSIEVTGREPALTPELDFHPHLQFLHGDESEAWLFHTNGNWKSKLAYSICRKHGIWEKPKTIPTASWVGSCRLTLGSALRIGSERIVYGSTYDLKPQNWTPEHGVGYRFSTVDGGRTWRAQRLSVTGIEAPFQREGMLMVRVVRWQGEYFLSTQAAGGIRYLARSQDGVHFEVVENFGVRPSLGNALVVIDAVDELLLIYADASGGEKLGGKIEVMRYPIPGK